MTGREPKHRDWIKLWIKESLLGTIREDLAPEERSTWYDFLLLAGNCRIPGTISANENTPIPPRRIAAILNVEEPLVKRCIVKFEKSGRITIDKTGVIRIVNWDKYQYTDYDRQKPYRQQAKHNARWEAMPKEQKAIAIEAFGPVESWDEMNWIAATGKLSDEQRENLNRELETEGHKPLNASQI